MLDSLWTETFAHAGIPPNVINDDYVRHAIYETSKIEVPPPPPPPAPPTLGVMAHYWLVWNTCSVCTFGSFDHSGLQGRHNPSEKAPDWWALVG